MNNNLYSDTITRMRIPMLLLVIYIHSFTDPLLKGSFPVHDFFLKLIPCGISSIAVPSFFVMSGFLFFFNVDTFDFQIYKRKIRSRVKTLIIPYILWNLIYYVFRLILELTVKGSLSGTGSSVLQYNLYNFLSMFWACDLNPTFPSPIDGPLWYLRNLIVVSLLSFIIYFLIRKLNFVFPLAMFILWIFCSVTPFVGQFWTSLFFFSLGAYFSIFKFDILDRLEKYRYPIYIVFLSLLVVSFTDYNTDYLSYIKTFMGVSSAFLLFYNSAENDDFRVFPSFTKISFFIYAFHFIVCQSILRLSVKCLTLNDLEYTIICLLLPFIILLISKLVFFLLIKIQPHLFSVLNGGR